MLQVGGCQEVPLQKGCGVGTSRLGVRYGLKRLVGCLSAGSLEQRRSFSGGGRSPIGWRQIRFGEPPVQRTQKASFLLRGHGALYNRPYVRAVLPNSTLASAYTLRQALRSCSSTLHHKTLGQAGLDMRQVGCS